MPHTTFVARFRAASLAAMTASLLFAPALSAQSFGRNKVQYETFDFRIMRSAHFDVHFYPAESLATVDATRMAERWYTRLSAILGHGFTRRPLVFYANHPDFQQTNVISGLIDQSTGGVTEGARNRVIIPFTGVPAANDHVIGHEIVHVFQYDISDSLMRSPGTRGGGIESLPLWLVEGMAEYLSIGRRDAHTAMWLRDAVLRKDLPTIRQLTTDSRFFPYRYGEALWAYIGGKWGDKTVGALYRASLREGFEPGIRRVLGITHDSLSKEWHSAIRDAYTPLMAGMTLPKDAGRRVLGTGKVEDGELENSPSLSPDGKWVAFLSARNLVSIDLFVADAETGRIVKKLTSPNRDEHFSSLSFINSAGSWSPNGKQLAFVTFADGDNEIAIFDVEREAVVRNIKIPGVDGINDVAWGPAGQLAVAGTRGGIGDLFIFDLETEHLRQLTNDRFAELHPAWSPNGKSIAYATDRRGLDRDLDELTHAPMRLAIIDVADRTSRLLAAFPGAKHINPQFAPDGQSLYFVSDPDGFSNVYRMSLADGALTQVTQIATGVSGITALSPALAVASQTGRMVFSVFEKSGDILYRLEPAAIGEDPSPLALRPSPFAGLLPPFDAESTSAVELYLADATTGLPSADSLKVQPLRTGLGLEYLGAPALGVSIGGVGSGLGGSIQAFFSDMLNNNVVGATLFAEGGWYGLGAEAFYLNQKQRLNWALGAGHVPYIVGIGAGVRDTVVRSGGRDYDALVYDEGIARIYLDQASLSARYPLSSTRRLEAGISANRQTYGLQGVQTLVVGNQVVGQTSSNGSAGDGVRYGQANLAYVGDYSSFGLTSPIAGGRYRFEVSPVLGDLKFTTLSADYRRYVFMKPATFAIRGLHYGRYGQDAENANWMQSLFVGYSSLIRGYSAESFSASECTSGDAGGCPEFNRLLGSRIAVANAELRIPVFGPKQLALIPFPLPIEFAPFVDAGAAWTRDSSPTPVFSAGLSTRVNLFGAMIVEMFYAHPFQRAEKGAHFGFQLLPGW